MVVNRWTPNAKYYDFGRPFPSDKVTALFERQKLSFDSDSLDILEPGCGTGRVLIPLANKFNNWRFRGFDFSAEALAVCQDRLDKLALTNVKISEDSLDTFVSTEKFDLIIHSSLLHAVTNWRESILTLSKLLKPRGLITLIGDYGDIYDEALGRPSKEGIDPNLVEFWSLYREIRGKVGAPDLERSQVGCRWDLESTELADWLLANGFMEQSRDTVEWTEVFKLDDLMTIVEERCYSSMFNMALEDYSKLVKELRIRISDLDFKASSISRHKAVARFFSRS